MKTSQEESSLKKISLEKNVICFLGRSSQIILRDNKIGSAQFGRKLVKLGSLATVMSCIGEYRGKISMTS